MEDGQKSIPLYILQPKRIAYTWLGKINSPINIHPISDPMARNDLVHHTSRRWLETHPHRNAAIHRQYIMDNIIHYGQ